MPSQIFHNFERAVRIEVKCVCGAPPPNIIFPEMQSKVECC